MALADAVALVCDGIDEEIKLAQENDDTTVPLATLRGFARQLRAALKAVEGTANALAAPQTAVPTPGRVCTHLPRDSGVCRCNGTTCGSAVCCICSKCGKVKPSGIALGSADSLATVGAPPAQAVQAEEQFRGGQYFCEGGMLDGTCVPIDAAPQPGGKIRLNGEIYVFREGAFHYSVDETMAALAEKKPAAKKLVIPGQTHNEGE